MRRDNEGAERTDRQTRWAYIGKRQGEYVFEALGIERDIGGVVSGHFM